jgi:phosphate starvation-inducible PhoH-like protein
MARKTRKRQQAVEEFHQYRQPKVLQAKSENQAILMNSIKVNDITFVIGPAGSGKSYIAGAMAAIAFENRDIDQIIFTRPAVEVGEKLGALPGTLEEKYSPYVEPFTEILEEWLGEGHLEYAIKKQRIRGIPLGFMRGRTLKNCYAILDEAQNTTPKQMKTFLTRIGEGSKLIINGDLTQQDTKGESGLADALYRLQGIESVGIVEFTKDDIVRHGLIQRIIEAYE